jgi:hypothetical protein
MRVRYLVATTVWSSTNILRLTDEKDIKTRLRVKLGLSTGHRAKHYLTLRKYKIIASVVWDKDWCELDHEAARVAFSAKLNMFCFSSARLGEVTESSAKAGTGQWLHYRVSISSLLTS